MPLFFIASGCMYALGKGGSIRGKVRSIVVPYFCFSFLWFPYWLLIESRFRPMPEHGIFAEWLPNMSIQAQQFLNIFIACNGDKAFIYNGVLWFLACLFVSHCIFHYLNRCRPAFQIGGGIALVCTYEIIEKHTNTLPWFTDIAMLAVPFMLIGRWTYRTLYNHRRNRVLNFTLLAASTGVFVFSVSTSGKYLNMMEHNIPALWWLYTIPCCGYLMTYCLSIIIYEHGWRTKDILIWLGQNSLLIMCLHEPIKRIVIKLYAMVLHLDTESVRVLLPHCLFITLSVTIICVPIIYVINKWLPWMAGHVKHQGHTS